MSEAGLVILTVWLGAVLALAALCAIALPVLEWLEGDRVGASAAAFILWPIVLGGVLVAIGRLTQ